VLVNLLPSAYRRHDVLALGLPRTISAWLRCAQLKRMWLETMGNRSSGPSPILVVFMTLHHNAFT
jgi:hypothetical protein